MASTGRPRSYGRTPTFVAMSDLAGMGWFVGMDHFRT
jgi:hypothetical protein